MAFGTGGFALPISGGLAPNGMGQSKAGWHGSGGGACWTCELPIMSKALGTDCDTLQLHGIKPSKSGWQGPKAFGPDAPTKASGCICQCAWGTYVWCPKAIGTSSSSISMAPVQIDTLIQSAIG